MIFSKQSKSIVSYGGCVTIYHVMKNINENYTGKHTKLYYTFVPVYPFVITTYEYDMLRAIIKLFTLSATQMNRS